MLRSLLQRRGVHVGAMAPGETEEQTLLRYLRARGGKLDKAASMYAASVAWREVQGINSLRAEADGAVVLGCKVSILQAVLPHWHGGVDTSGGPIIFKHMGEQCVMRSLLEHTTLDNIARYNIWLNERYLDALASCGAREWSVIVDAAGWWEIQCRVRACYRKRIFPAKGILCLDMCLFVYAQCIHVHERCVRSCACTRMRRHVGLFDRTAFRFLKATAMTDAAHYPDLLRVCAAGDSTHMSGGAQSPPPCGQPHALLRSYAPMQAMIIVNAPHTLAVAWRVIRAWVDEETRQKIDIISERDPDRARARLHEVCMRMCMSWDEARTRLARGCAHTCMRTQTLDNEVHLIWQVAHPSQLPLQYGGTAQPIANWPERSGVPTTPEQRAEAATRESVETAPLDGSSTERVTYPCARVGSCSSAVRLAPDCVEVVSQGW